LLPARRRNSGGGERLKLNIGWSKGELARWGIGGGILLGLLLLVWLQYRPLGEFRLTDRSYDSSCDRNFPVFPVPVLPTGNTVELRADFDLTCTAAGRNLLFTTGNTEKALRILQTDRDLTLIFRAAEQTEPHWHLDSIRPGVTYHLTVVVRDHDIKVWKWEAGHISWERLIPIFYKSNLDRQLAVTDIALGAGNFHGRIEHFNFYYATGNAFFPPSWTIPLTAVIGLLAVWFFLIRLIPDRERRPALFRPAAMTDHVRSAAEQLIALVGLTAVGWLVFHETANLPAAVVEAMRRQITSPPTEFQPERPERLAYIAVCLAAPILYAAAFLLFRRWRPEERNGFRRQAVLLLPLVLPMLGLLFWQCHNQLINHFLFKPLAWSTPLLVTTLALALAIALIGRNGRRYEPGERRLLLGLIVLLPILQVFAFRLYWPESLHRCGWHDLGIMAYAVSQAAIGNPEFHQYGFYPQFLAPLFRLTGTSTLVLSAVMGALYIAGFILVAVAVRRQFRVPILLWGMLAALVVATSWGALNLHDANPVFSYYPIRFIGPALLLWLFVRAVREEFSRGKVLVLGIVGGIMLFWNLEAAISPVAAALFGIITTCRPHRRRDDWSKIGFAVGGLAAGLTGTYLALSWNMGQWIRPTGYSHFHEYFLAGFNMLPLPTPPAPWVALGLVYLGGLGWGLRREWTSQANAYSRILLFLSITGMGLFIWYQGRSHPYSFPSVIWPGIVILMLAADRIVRAVRAHLLPPIHLGAALPGILITALATMVLFCNADTWFAHLQTGIREWANGGIASPTQENVNFIKRCAGTQRTVNIFGDGQGVYYAETGLRAGIPQFNLVEVFLHSERERIFRALQKSSYPLFWARSFLNMELSGELPAKVLKHYRLEAVSPDGIVKYYVPRSDSASSGHAPGN